MIEPEPQIAEAPAPEPYDPEHLRIIEALLFASAVPVREAAIAIHLPGDVDLRAVLNALRAQYAERGVNLMRVGEGWAFRTAADLAGKLKIEQDVPRKLSRAAVETLAVIAYHQPITRAEIEEVRGVSQSRGTLDVLLEAGWIKPGRRRQTPGRPVTWHTTNEFLDHFGLENLKDLPGVEELKAAGLLDTRPAAQAFRGEDMQDLLDEEDEAEEDREIEEELGIEHEEPDNLVDLSESFRRSGRATEE
ncbi:MAG: SMC-Scp complex subunit ScpB [Alphaproteobacteria bacterium]|nr:SMC-Scp complex subunit ScpB [Alphaproteobacteria bacterium]